MGLETRYQGQSSTKTLLLHYSGANLLDIYYMLTSENDEEQIIKEKLDAHFEPMVIFTVET